MKRIFSLLISFQLLSYFVIAQFNERHNFVFLNNRFDVFTIKIDSALLQNLKIVVNSKHLSEEEFFKSVKIDTPFFAITASIVDSGCNPLGLYVKTGNKIADINTANGSGNFYLNPNGYIATDSSKVVISESKKYDKSAIYNYAIQSGPMLLVNGIINSNFDKNSKNRNIRCGVGLYTFNKSDYLVFVKSISPVSFFDLANIFLTKYKCVNALCLESGGLCSMYLPTIKMKYKSDVSVCNYLFIKL